MTIPSDDTMPKPLVQSVAVQCYSTAIIGALSAQVMTVARMAKAAQLAIEEMPGASEQKDIILPMLMDVGTEMWKQLDMLRCTRTTLGRLMPGMMDEREDDA